MAFSTRKTIGAVFGAACLTAVISPASAGTLSVAPAKHVGLSAPITEVASRTRHVRTVRHVTVRRHHVGPRRYYSRGYYNNVVPAAALGLFAGVLGAAISSGYNDCYDGYGYGYGCGYAPSYSYGYGFPVSYGFAQPQYFYSGRRVVRHGGHWGGRQIAVPHYRGGFSGRSYGGGVMRAGIGGGRGGFGGGGHGGGGRR